MIHPKIIIDFSIYLGISGMGLFFYDLKEHFINTLFKFLGGILD